MMLRGGTVQESGQQAADKIRNALQYYYEHQTEHGNGYWVSYLEDAMTLALSKLVCNA